MRRIILSLGGFLVLFVFAQHFAEAATKHAKTRMPYQCHELQTTEVKQYDKNDFEYHFKGICTLKNADGQYQDVWVKSIARWQGENHSALERLTVLGEGGGLIELSMKCADNPWLTDARCVLLTFGNATEFASLVTSFRVKKADESIQAFPPVSRGAIGIQDFITLAKQKPQAEEEVVYLDTDELKDKAFNDTALKADQNVNEATQLSDAITSNTTTDQASQPVNSRRVEAIDDAPRLTIRQTTEKPNNNNLSAEQVADEVERSPSATSLTGILPKIVDELTEETDKPIAKPSNVFYAPKYKGNRVHYCYQRNKGCGMRAASQWCRANGFRKAATYQIDSNIGYTVHMADGVACRSASCDGFESITCVH